MRVNEAEALNNSRQLRDKVLSYGLGFCNFDAERCSEHLNNRLRNYQSENR
jgi:hypothetical protein